MNEPFLYKATSINIENMKQAYPELESRKDTIASVTKMEEENFFETLETGTQLLDGLISKYTSSKTIPGKDVFKLYDTFGFPVELTKEIAMEKGLSIDEEGFAAEQKIAQDKSRAAWSGSGEKDVTLYSKIQKEHGETLFKGYETF